MNTRSTDLLLGVVFFITLGALGFVTVVLSELTFGKTRYEVELFSPDVGFLRPGDPVLLYGMAAGKVETVSRLSEPENYPDKDGRPVSCAIRIAITLDADLYEVLTDDALIRIEDRGLLGGKLIRIVQGGSTELVSRETPLVALSSGSLWQTASEILEENRGDLRATVDGLAELADRARAGEGLIGTLLYDEELPDQLREVSDGLTNMVKDLQAGQGIAGRLVSDEEMGARFETLVQNLSDSGAEFYAIGQDLRAGEGTLGLLLTEESLHEDLRTFFADAQGIMDDVSRVSSDLAEGRGTLGRLLSDDELGDRASVLIDNLTAFSNDLRGGKGLISVLLSDEQLASDMKQIVASALGALQDARESAPVQGVGSLLFGTF